MDSSYRRRVVPADARRSGVRPVSGEPNPNEDADHLLVLSPHEYREVARAMAETMHATLVKVEDAPRKSSPGMT